MARFHVRPEAITADRVVFDEQETRHLSRVLRLRPGDSVQVVDGRGTEFTVRLESIEGRAAAGTILTRSSAATESPLAVTLAQGIPKGDKMEWIVRTVTELGVARVVPLVTERTIVRLEPGRWRDRARRWQRVAKEAAKQCGRAVIPTVDPPRPLQEFADAAPAADLRLCLWEGEHRGLSEILDAARGPVASALLVVGPEGGLAAREVETLVARGFTSAGLGPRILRTETAGPVGVALLQGRFGDVGAPRRPVSKVIAPPIDPARVRAPAGYDYFDVAADVGVKAWGPTLPEAFAQAGLGVFALMVEPGSVEARESREVRAQGETPEALLVNWLNECLYVHDIEGFVVSRIEFPLFEGKRVHSLLWGEDLDPARHRVGTVVKAATFHELRIGRADGRWEVRVILDI